MLQAPQQQHANSFAGGAGYPANLNYNGGAFPTPTPPPAFQQQQYQRADGVISPPNGIPQSSNGGQPYFTSAPYGQVVPAQAPIPHQDQNVRQQQSLSPHVGSLPHNQDPSAAPNFYPMAAPPIPQTPTSNNTAAPSPKSPQSPGSQNREQQRINLLFELNVELLQEVNRLQSEGQGGAISPQQLIQYRSEGKPDKMASDEYIQCLRRVQANLSYLMPKASPDPASQAKAPLGPAHMTPPPHMPQLLPKYEHLRELFPGWSGMDHRPSQSSSSPKPNGIMAPPAPTQQQHA